MPAEIFLKRASFLHTEKYEAAQSFGEKLEYHPFPPDPEVLR